MRMIQSRIGHNNTLTRPLSPVPVVVIESGLVESYLVYERCSTSDSPNQVCQLSSTSLTVRNWSTIHISLSSQSAFVCVFVLFVLYVFMSFEVGTAVQAKTWKPMFWWLAFFSLVTEVYTLGATLHVHWASKSKIK